MLNTRRFIALAAALVAAACSADAAGRQPLAPNAPRHTVTTGQVACPDTIEVGQTAQCSSAYYDQNGIWVGVVTPSWSSSNTGVLTVDASGNITGVAVGTATVTATYAGVPASDNVVVKPGPTATIVGPSTVRRFTSCTWTRSVSGGKSPYTYYWEDTNGNPSGTSSSYTAQVISAGDDISLTVTDAYGATYTVIKHVTSNTTAPLC